MPPSPVVAFVASCRCNVEIYLVPAHASVVCRDHSECSFRFITCHSVSSRGLYSLPVLGCLIRPRGTLVQWLLTSKWPARHSAILVFTDHTGCSFRFTACYMSAGGLYSLEWVSLYRLRGTLMQPLLEGVRPLAQCSDAVRTVLARRSCCRCFTSCLCSVQGLYSLEHASLYGLGRALMHLLLERVRPLPPSASVVRIDPTDAHPAAI